MPTTPPTGNTKEQPDRAYGMSPDGFRLPSDTRVGRVRLQVADLRRSLGFYEGALGLRVLSQAVDCAELTAQGDDRVLIELRRRSGAKAVPRRGTLGLFHFAMLVPDRAALGRFLRHVLHVGAVSGLADHAVSEAIYLTDPDGLGMEVYADRPRQSWRVDHRGQLYMTTESLDVGGLIEAAGEQPWDGFPAGTTMGHVHLHVGDLGQAEAFYHRALGFDKVVWTFPGALFLSAGGYHHHLGTNTWSSGAPAAGDQARLLSWDLEVPHMDDADAAARSLTRGGYPVTRQAGSWRTSDPWGTVLELRAAH